MVGIGNILGGAVGIGGQFLGGSQAGAAETAAQNLRQQALAQLMGIENPDIELMRRNYIVPELMGEYTPEMEQMIDLGPTAMEGISVDPRLAQSQFKALEQLAGLSESGFSPADIAALEQVRRGAAAQDQARQQTILQEMQQRGQGGSGAELIAKLKSGQAAADRASQEGMNVAQMAQQRALQALMSEAGLAGQVRGQEFSEQSDVARAKDIINKFNTQNQLSQQQRNVGSQNIAQQQNLANRQAQEQQRANIRNLEQDVNKDLYQQRFQNEMQRGQAIAGQQNTMAGATQQTGYNRAGRTQQQAGSIGDMFGGLGGMFGI